MSARSDVLLWAQRVMAKKGAPAHELLEIKEHAGFDAAQVAFHKVAKMAHPDLHRSSLTADDLEIVTLAYSRVAGAYQDLRTTTTTQRIKPIKDGSATTPPPTGAGNSGAMSSKALVCYRKAEGALRRGDLKGALLQLKLAIAADPASTLLRSALTEVETELKKPPA